MEELKDGGPAFLCRICRLAFVPRAWQVTSRDYRCLPCKREQQNASNAANPEQLKERARKRYAENKGYWARYAAERRTDPEYLRKRSARRKVSTEIEAGRLTRMPCVACGSTTADAHHHDYSRPLDITWLCRACHIRHEKEMQRAAA